MRNALRGRFFMLHSSLFVTAALLLSGCTKDEGAAQGGERTAVNFHAEIMKDTPTPAVSHAPRTRTTGGGDSWKTGDQVGISMVKAGGSLSVAGDVLAQNKLYNVTATTGTLAADDGTDIYYPMSGNVDFIAYYPYGATGTGAGEVTQGHVYNISVTGQTTEAAQNAIDVLYVKKRGAAKSPNPVALAFDHVMSKITLNLAPGGGFTAADIANLAAADVKFAGMPVTATLALQEGALTAGEDLAQSFSPLKAATAAAPAAAAFTAVLVPQAGMTGRKAVFTIGGEEFTGDLPATAAFEAGKHYTYPVTVTKTGVAFGAATITPWEEMPPVPGTPQAVSIDVVKIGAGRFLMGSSNGRNEGGVPGTDLNATPKEPQRFSDETQHWVTLTNGFYMSKYEITNAQYAEFLNANKIGSDGKGTVTYTVDGKVVTESDVVFIKDSYGFKDQSTLIYTDWGLNWNDTADRWEPSQSDNTDHSDYPVILISWYGAKAYADWIGGALPTEAQWEYACRGGKENTPFGVGTTGLTLNYELANFYWLNSYQWDGSATGSYILTDKTNKSPRKTQKVGLYPPNAFGLYDMHGNVSEVCLDNWDGDTPYGSDAVVDPLGTTGSRRIARGGAWSNEGQSCRSAFRIATDSDFIDAQTGIRVVFPAP